MFIDKEFYSLSIIYFSYMSNPMFNFLSTINLSDEVKKRLSQYLSGNVVKGNNSIYLTPIAKDNDPELILKEWDNIFNSKLHLINDNLKSLELSNRSKFGPRSIAKPWKDRKATTLSYFDNDKCRYSINQLLDTNLPKANFRPISVQRASNYLKNSTNSGLPYYMKKSLVKERVISRFDELLSRKDPCILFTRTQEGDKTRDVWGYPIADTLNEMTVYQPLLEYQKELNWRSVLKGPAEVDLSITKMMVEAFKFGYYLVSIDFEGFDRSFLRTLQRASFEYIKLLFQSKYHNDIDYMFERFNTIGLVTPSGISSGAHGVPSGSTFTNEVDSIGQFLVAMHSKVVDSNLINLQGDDGAYVIKTLNDIKTLFMCFEAAGLKVNKTKSYVSKDYLVYLQKLYDRYYMKDGFIGGIYPTYRALNRILYQERYSDFEEFEIKGIDYYSIRTITILENCKYHPLFEDFVKFIKKYDKYSLSFSQEGLSKFKVMDKDKRGTVGVINNQFGDDIRGLRSFQAYKIINS